MGELVEQVRIASSAEALATATERLDRVETRLSALLDQWLEEWKKVCESADKPKSQDAVTDKVLQRIRQDAETVSHRIEGLDASSVLSTGPFPWHTFAGAEVALGALQEVRRLMDALGSSTDPQTRADALWKAFHP